MTTEEMIEKKVQEALYALLHPIVEIVSLDNPVPDYATPGDACVDLRASLKRVKTEFLDNAYLMTREDEIHQQLQEAMAKDDRTKVEQLWKLYDSCKESNTLSDIVALVVKPGGHCLVPTGVFTSMPSDYVLHIVPRSGAALKKKITFLNSPGMVDSGYRDEIGVILDNLGHTDYIILPGDRIAQGEFALKCTPTFVVKENQKMLSGPNRGGGFGHSGTV